MNIKKICILFLLCIGLVSCNNSNSYQKGDEIRVTFHLNGGNLIIGNQKVESNVSIKVDEDFFFTHRYIPNKENMLFSNWYLDEALKTPLDIANYEVDGDIDVYARWTESYFEYTLKEDNTIAIGLNQVGTTKTNITIPSYINGYKVNELKDYGFAYSNATKLYLPNTIEIIGFSCFYESKLEYIELTENVNDIKYGAFIGTNYIKQVKVDKNSHYLVHNLTLFEKIDKENNLIMHSFFDPLDLDIARRYYGDNIKIKEIAPYCFYGRKNIHSFELPRGIYEIGDYAFAYSGLSKFYMNYEPLKIGNYAFAESYLNQAILFLGIEHIGDYCFKNTLLTTLHIPGTIKFIGDGAFQNDLLKNITVGPNDKYFLDDGHLLGKIDNDNYELLYFNNLRRDVEYHLDSKITKINSGAFYSIEGIDTLYLTNVKEVEDYLFFSLNEHQTLIFETDAVNVAERAFFEEKRNMSFYFNAVVPEDSIWSNHFYELRDYVTLTYIENI